VLVVLAGKVIKTNRISVTERFKPLQKDADSTSAKAQEQTSVLPGTVLGRSLCIPDDLVLTKAVQYYR
jgi:hypothetical protein